ncbi:MAG: HlyD family efflux transporter periplasmic adaptor subunit [Planctomycetia bacterium]|nr:HlyD family efflux transporter periplasmic adaptor subunit [Planctomycetia bacterium]
MKILSHHSVRFLSTALLGGALALTAGAGSAEPPLVASLPPRAPSESARAVIGTCLISLIEEAEVPAQEQGVLSDLLVREGSMVRKNQVLGRISDRVPRLQKQMAEGEYQTSKAKSENDINVRYAVAAAQVAQAGYDAALEANREVRFAVGSSDLRKLKLEAERARLAIEQSQLEQKVLAYDLTNKAAAVEAADDAVRRRQVIAPIDGEIVELRRHLGEWLNPGQPVLRMVRMDRLRVEGFVAAARVDPSELVDRPVRVDVETSHGRRYSATGRVVFLSPLLQAGGEYRVWAEVDNVQERGRWLLQPGLTARMTIE